MSSFINNIRKSLNPHLVKDACAGLVSGFVAVPLMVSFNSIIFRNEAFVSFTPYTGKLVLLSAMIHQTVGTMFSTMPFAVMQVQDAGLIFLSGMAADIAEKCRERGIPDDEMIATTLTTLGVATMLLGAMLMLAGYCKVATLMQYLPMPVIGGYLAYIGLFCAEAGLSMMTGVSISSLSDIPKLFVPHYLILLTPGLVAGIILYKLLIEVKSSLTLPVFLACILVGFYAILFGCGYTLQDARDYGWIAPLTPQMPLTYALSLYAPHKVHFDMMLDQFPRWAGMFMVVAFGSSLDVAAIEMELGLPLDYNRELATVGRCNFMSGMGGGFTGSYLFTQTIFLMRSGVSTCGAGFTLAAVNLLIIMLPFDITASIPRTLFGALLINIGVELLWDWLAEAYHKMVYREYLVCLLSFFAILAYGVEIGLTVGILFAMVLFVHTYASVSTVTVSKTATSKVLRNFEERAVLFANKGQIVTVSLNGYIFFGSALSILNEVKRNVVITGDVIRTGRKEANDLQSVSRQARSRARSQSNSSINSRTRPTVTPASQPIALPPVREDMEDVAPLETEMSFIGSALQYQPVHGDIPEDYMSEYSTNDDRDRAMTLDEVMQASSIYDMSGQTMLAHYERWKVATDQETVDPVFPFIETVAEVEEETGNDFPSIPCELGTGEAEGAEGEGEGEGEGDGETEESPSNDIEEGKNDSETEKDSNSITVETSAETYTYETPRMFPFSGFFPSVTSPVSPPVSCPSPALSDKSVSNSVLDVVWDSESIFRRRRSAGDSTSTATALAPVEDGNERSALVPPAGSSNYGAINQVSSPIPTVSIPLKKQPSFIENVKVKTEFLVLDFTGVVGVEATAARTCFLMLMQLMRSSGIPIVYANMSESVKKLLESHEVVHPHDIIKPQLDIALEFCENQILEKANKQKALDFGNSFSKVVKTKSEISGLQRILLDYLEVDVDDLSNENELAVSRVLSFMRREVLQKYFVHETAITGQIVYDQGSIGDKVYFVESGAVDILHPAHQTNHHITSAHKEMNVQREKRIVEGGLFGEDSFFLGKPHSCNVVVTADCVLWTLNRHGLSMMERDEPKLCVLVQHLLLKSMALSASWNAMQTDSSYRVMFE